MNNLSKFIGTSIITASLAFVSVNHSVQAQEFEPGIESEGVIVQEDDGFDWGWLGLLGLLGLAGLAGGKKRHEVVHERTNHDVVAPTHHAATPPATNDPDVVLRDRRSDRDYR